MKSITFMICTMRGGGAERVISVLSDYFANKHYNVSIITTGGDILDYELNDKVKYIPTIVSCKIPVFKQLLRVLKIRMSLKRQNPDIVVAFLPTACIYAAMCKIMGLSYKLAISERMDPNQDPNNKLLRKIRDYFYAFGDGFIFQTEDAKAYFSQDIQKKSCIIPNPLKKGLPNPYCGVRKSVVVTAVRLEPQKNVKMLIDAFGIFLLKFPNHLLKIYGEGYLRNDLQQYIMDKGLETKILLMGFSKNIHSDILDASYFVLPSNYEGISNSMIEALAIGLPVISTDHPIGGARLFIKDGENGLLVPVNDTEKFANAMIMLSNDEKLLNKMSNTASLIKKQLESTVIAKQWEMFLEHLFDKS